MAPPLRLLVTGTDTDVGKTWVTRLLATALRRRGRRVWLWKPVACGGWADGCAEDVRELAGLIGDGQDPDSLCRHQWPEPASPHLAARAAGSPVTLAELVAEGRALSADDHDLLVEGAGGLLSPLSDDLGTGRELAAALDLRPLVVVRPHLGTINHSALTVAALRADGREPLGLVVNHHEPVAESLATRDIAAVLAECCACPVLAVIGHGQVFAGDTLAERVVAAHDPHPPLGS